MAGSSFPGGPLALAIVLLAALPGVSRATEQSTEAARPGPWALTVYGARISSEVGWEDILLDPIGARYVDAYLVAAALSRRYASFRDDGLVFEAEGQVVWNFGSQHHWEFNAMPVVARWQRFPWRDRLATSAAFGLGLSYATEVPQAEIEIEGDSEQWLIYWVAELTAGPPRARWAVSLRLHHRSPAWGLMGDEGGMNAMGLGLRWQF